MATSKGSSKAGPKVDLRKQIIVKAIVDPKFRKTLFADPEAVFGGKLTAADHAALERMQKMIPSLHDIVGHLAGEVLCGGGGGCGGLA